LFEDSSNNVAESANFTIDGDIKTVQSATLNDATGNEVALTLNYTTNKATSGNDTGLNINQTNTASPGTSLLLDAQVGGTSKFKIDNGGAVTITGALTSGAVTSSGVGVFTGSVTAKTTSSGLVISNTTEGGTGNFHIGCKYEAHTLALSGNSTTTTISIPSGALVIAVQFCVETAVTDDSGDGAWGASLNGGGYSELGASISGAKNTKHNNVFDSPEKMSGTTQVRFTPDSYGNFTAGKIRVTVYYKFMTDMVST
jgi:hypothetical protein